MIVTRKIQVYACNTDAEKRKEDIHTLYTWRDLCRRGANMVVAHKYVQQNVRDFVYITDEMQEKFLVKDILVQGRGMSEQNVTYRLLSNLMKGQLPADVYTTLNQNVANTFKETVKEINMGRASVRSYKNNIPIPFSGKSVSNIHWVEANNRFEFTLFGIEMACALGHDRSGNRVVLDRCLAGEYKICSSGLQIDDRKKKMFLLLCVDMPKQEVKLDEERVLYVTLSVDTPIVASLDRDALFGNDSRRKVEIGTKEEFLYRRTQIQMALHNAQVAARYNKGGKGRKKKLQALERYHEKETHYVDTRLHTYSRMLVDLAVKQRCATIQLVNQEVKEQQAREEMEEGEPFLLRNWSYFGLKTKIEYKAKMVGITVKDDAGKVKEERVTRQQRARAAKKDADTADAPATEG
jgi:hypothetical protein